MQIDRKDATVSAPDDEFPGTFEVVLSTADQDRDGETLSRDTWLDLPDHISFDVDHEMSVRGTVGSGKPSFDAENRLVVKGRFASTAQAQETRTLIREGHITKTSVAFRRDRTGVKDGRPEMRELLNGAFVAIPSNRSADILLAKSYVPGVKLGARNNEVDHKHIQAIHDHTAALGAGCNAPAESTEAQDEDAPDDAADKTGDKAKEKAEKALSDFRALPHDVRLSVLKALAADDDDDDTDPEPAVKAASAKVPTADDIALRARAIALGLNLTPERN